MRVGQTLADCAATGILAQRGISQAELPAAQLRTALTSRIVIEQAKGVLAERLKIDMDQAFALLRDHARRVNQRLSDVAREVTENIGTAASMRARFASE